MTMVLGHGLAVYYVVQVVACEWIYLFLEDMS